MDTKFFPMFHTYLETMSALTDEQFGRLFRAALRYSRDGEMPDLNGFEMMAFGFLKLDIDRAKEKYEAIAERNRINGAKGGRPRKDENPVGFLGTQENPEKPQKPIEREKEREKENVIEREGVNTAADAADTPAKRQRKAFVPPTVDEVRAYCDEQRFGTINPAAFVDYYSANGWRVGNHAMKDWRATLRNWARRDKEKGIVPKSAGSFETDEFFDAAVKASYARIEQTKDEPQESAPAEELPEPVVMPSGKRDYSGLWSKIM